MQMDGWKSQNIEVEIDNLTPRDNADNLSMLGQLKIYEFNNMLVHIMFHLQTSQMGSSIQIYRAARAPKGI